MQEIQGTIRRLVKSLKKTRQELAFVHDIKVLNSSYEIDHEDRKFQEELRRKYLSLKQQRKTIESTSDWIIAKIDVAIQNIEHFLQ